MINLSPELLTLILLGGIVAGAFTGYPVALVIGFMAMVVGYSVFGAGVTRVIYMGVYGMMTNYILLAVPLFIFMGLMLERSGIADSLFDALYNCLGGLRGGLAIVTVLVGTIMAATVGIIAASITMLSLVALPSMMKHGYSKSLASGSIVAGGCLGILIPPSIMLVIYGPLAGVSVGRLFLGAFLPGFVLSALYIIYIIIHSYLKPEIAPVISAQLRETSLLKNILLLVKSLGPVIILILSVLGVIFFGLAPPTEAAGAGALISTALVIVYGRFNLKVLKETAMMTVKMCGLIFLFTTMAVSFSSVFLAIGGGGVVSDLIGAVPGGKWGFFVVANLIVFIMGMFMQWMGIVFIMVPILTPIAVGFGFDIVWFSIIVCINLQMALMTPPFACGLFIMKGVCPKELGVTMGDIVRGIIPFVLLVMVGIVIFTIFPQIILWLPNMMLGK